MNFHCIFLLLFLLIFESVFSDTSFQSYRGGKETLTLSAVDTYCDIFKEEIVEAVASVNIPDTSFNINTPIGSITFNLDDGAFTTFYIGDVSLGFTDDIGVNAHATDLEVRLTFQWSFKQQTFPYMSDGGELDVSVSKAYFYVLVGLTADDEGYEYLQMDDVEFTIESLNIVIHGNMEDLYSIIVAALEPTITVLVENTIDIALKTSVETMVNAAIRNSPTCNQVNVNENHGPGNANDSLTSGLDERMVADPVIVTQYMASTYSYVWVQDDTPLYTSMHLGDEIPDVIDSSGLQHIFSLDYIGSLAWIFYYRDAFNYSGSISSSSLSILVPDGSTIPGMCLVDDDTCLSTFSVIVQDVPDVFMLVSAVDIQYPVIISISQKSSMGDSWTTIVSATATINMVAWPTVDVSDNSLFFDFDLYTCSDIVFTVGAGNVDMSGFLFTSLNYLSSYFVPWLSSFAAAFKIDGIVVGDGCFCNEMAFFGDDYVALLGDVCPCDGKERINILSSEQKEQLVNQIESNLHEHLNGSPISSPRLSPPNSQSSMQIKSNSVCSQFLG
ncbi:BPI/LBP/Plunc family like protein [Aduncisulcus paluster]|uniref:BPI/LBP/Plunc family like protein n=1 Tax=Aduncisulcus paluster TaxID=2918883 RepID=A0ABQ5KW52_9EUKA|nr:BPI/LBP/Plunc family like protein [Aduncisulcus paluster]